LALPPMSFQVVLPYRKSVLAPWGVNPMALEFGLFPYRSAMS
jgi:hypothetical protein